MEVLSLEAMFNIAPQEMIALPSFPREAMVKAQVSVSPMGEVLKVQKLISNISILSLRCESYIVNVREKKGRMRVTFNNFKPSLGYRIRSVKGRELNLRLPKISVKPTVNSKVLSRPTKTFYVVAQTWLTLSWFHITLKMFAYMLCTLFIISQS